MASYQKLTLLISFIDKIDHMLDSLPTLKIIAADHVIVHEQHDAQRSGPLVASLEASGILRNPPIVAPLDDGSKRYMVLDGANRTTALQQMGFEHTLVQVVKPDSPGLDMKTWNHVIWTMPPEELMARLRAIPHLQFEQIEEKEGLRKLLNNHVLIWVQLPDERVYVGTTPEADLFEQIKTLGAIVDTYVNAAKMDRTKVRQISAVKDLYTDLTGLLVFPPIEVPQVLEVCSAGDLFPAGVTRFIVAPRALRVNYSLADLAADISLEEKNTKLDQWVKERVAGKGVRFYLEPTVLFDE